MNRAIGIEAFAIVGRLARLCFLLVVRGVVIRGRHYEAEDEFWMATAFGSFVIGIVPGASFLYGHIQAIRSVGCPKPVIVMGMMRPSLLDAGRNAARADEALLMTFLKTGTAAISIRKWSVRPSAAHLNPPCQALPHMTMVASSLTLPRPTLPTACKSR